MLTRNYDSIQFETLRRSVDDKFNKVHDELTEAFYNKVEFRKFGVLDKKTFNKLHALIFYLRDLEFHKQNLLQKSGDRLSTNRYNEVVDTDGTSKLSVTDIATEYIRSMKEEGIELVIE